MAVDYYRGGYPRRARDEVQMEPVALITVRDLDTGRCVGFFRSADDVLLAVAKAGISNWVAEQRHPTLEEIDSVFAAQQYATADQVDVWQSVRRRDP